MNQVIKQAAASYVDADQEYQSISFDWYLLGKRDSETENGLAFWRKIRNERFEILANLLALEDVDCVSKWIFDNAYKCFQEVIK